MPSLRFESWSVSARPLPPQGRHGEGEGCKVGRTGQAGRHKHDTGTHARFHSLPSRVSCRSEGPSVKELSRHPAEESENPKQERGRQSSHGPPQTQANTQGQQMREDRCELQCACSRLPPPRSHLNAPICGPPQPDTHGGGILGCVVQPTRGSHGKICTTGKKSLMGSLK